MKTADSISDPRQPSRFEKKKNKRSDPIGCADHPARQRVGMFPRITMPGPVDEAEQTNHEERDHEQPSVRKTAVPARWGLQTAATVPATRIQEYP